jgi:uncharacterized protein YoxC
MTISAEIYEIAVLIIAIAFLVLVIAAIPTLIQLKRTVKAVEELSEESRKSVKTLNGLLTRTGEQAGEFESMLQKFRDVGIKASNLGELVVDSVRNPLITMLSLLLGLEVGMKQLIKKKTETNKGETDGE